MWNSIIKNILLLIFPACLLLSGTACLAGTAPVRYDSSQITVRRPLPEALKEVVTDSDYVYDREPPAVSVWDKFWEWLMELLSNLFKGGIMGFGAVTITLFSLILALAIYLILRNRGSGIFYGKSADVKIDFREFDEDLNTIDFDALIEEAVGRKDYRKAVRLHFLRLLKELSDKKLIQWKIDKTNNDYSMELSNSGYRERFRELARLYEFIWYGDFHTDEEQFRQTISKFKSFQV